MTKHKLVANERFLHNGQLLEVGEEFTVTASEVSEYTNNGLAREVKVAKAPSRKAKADTEFATDEAVPNNPSENAMASDTEFASDFGSNTGLTANANQNLASQQNLSKAEATSFGLKNEEADK